MKNAKRAFVRYSLLSIFALITVLLALINVIDFSMAAKDADTLTAMLAQGRGSFFKGDKEGIMDPSKLRDEFAGREPGDAKGPFGRLGPNSPEAPASLRYFSFRIDEDGKLKKIAHMMNAVSDEEAAQWAGSLADERDCGWTRATYRYRVMHGEGETLVIVIDQGRELLSAYRILVISLVGEILVLLISYLMLKSLSERVLRPLAEAERKQQRFLGEVEKEFKIPLTVIEADTEILERSLGPNEQTLSIDRQVRKMTALVKDLSSLSFFDQSSVHKLDINLSDLVKATAEQYVGRFEDAGKKLTIDVEEGIVLPADDAAMSSLLHALLDNALLYSETDASIILCRQTGHVALSTGNDCSLTEGSYKQAFDRFVRLDNANGLPGAGLSLSRVKAIVKAHNGRADARQEGGRFIVSVVF